MSIKQELQDQFEQLEVATVSDSFGGERIGDRAPIFSFQSIMQWFNTQIDHLDEPLLSNLRELRNSMSPYGFKYTLDCLGRFSFCIELTNLSITSTKMKTRWLSGSIMKTRPNSFENYRGLFAPGDDERSSTFDECYEIFSQLIDLLVHSEAHKQLMEDLAHGTNRSVPYEAVFTYIDPLAIRIHISDNVRLVDLEDIIWLVQARPIVQSKVRYDLNGNRTKINEKIATKCYKTDRSQTGEVQTNRAKRWECLSSDFQHATIEQCWSVERRLLTDLVGFQGFPEETKELLIAQSLIEEEQEETLCPITFEEMSYVDLLGGGAHGESRFQVGHMTPLKAGGAHEGGNIKWISDNGNRIQGSLTVQETREMLINIFQKMTANGIVIDNLI